MDYKQNSYTLTFLFSILLLLLTSCGGGGGGSSTTSDPIDDQTQQITIDSTTSIQEISSILVEQKNHSLVKSGIAELLRRANLGLDSSTEDSISSNLANQEVNNIRISFEDFYNQYFGKAFAIGSNVSTPDTLPAFLEKYNMGIDAIGINSSFNYEWIYILGLKNGQQYNPSSDFVATDTLTPTQVFFILMEIGIGVEDGPDNYVDLLQSQNQNSSTASRGILSQGLLGLSLWTLAVGTIAVGATVALPVAVIAGAFIAGTVGTALFVDAVLDGQQATSNALEIASNSENVEMQQIQYEYSQPVYATSTTVDADRNEATVQEIDISSIPSLGNNTAITPPSNVQVSVGNQELTVNWSIVNEADSYNIYIAQESGIDINNYSSLLGGTLYQNATQPFTITGLSNNTTYYIVVTSVSNSAESNPSIEISASPIILNQQSGLIAHYQFDGNANDSSGNNNHGTENGSLNYVTGISGSAANFDGATTYIEVQDSPSINFTDAFTITTWLRVLGDTGINQRILTKWSIGSNTNSLNEISLGIDGNNGALTEDTINLSYANSTIQYPNYGLLNDGTWHHVAVVYDKTTSKIYINGSLTEVVNTSLEAPNGTNPLYIGGGASSNPMPAYIFHGLIDDLKIYNKALSQIEIIQSCSEFSCPNGDGVINNVINIDFESGSTEVLDQYNSFPILETTSAFSHTGQYSAHSVTDIGLLKKEFTPVTSGIVSMTCWMSLQGIESNSYSRCSMGSTFNTTNGEVGIGLFFNSITSGLDGVQVTSWDNGVWQAENNLAVVQSGIWYKLNIEYDFSTSTASFYVDNSLVFQRIIELSSISYLYFGDSSSQGGSSNTNESVANNIYIDDIEITGINFDNTNPPPGETPVEPPVDPTTQTINFSGSWSTTTSFQSCTNSENGTWVVDYANGLYSGQYTSQNTIEMPGCNYIGPWSCSGGNYPLNKTLVSEQDILVGMDTFVDNCLGSANGSVTSVTINNSNSVSLTGTYAGSNYSMEMSR